MLSISEKPVTSNKQPVTDLIEEPFREYQKAVIPEVGHISGFVVGIMGVDNCPDIPSGTVSEQRKAFVDYDIMNHEIGKTVKCYSCSDC